MRHWAIWALLGLTGCATVFLQDDGFREKKLPLCKDYASCRALYGEAKGRLANCADNTVGKIRCGDARQDLAKIEDVLSQHAEDEKQREKREAEEKADKRIAENKASHDADVQERKATAAEEARKAKMRQWAQTAMRACRARWDTEAYLPPPDGATPEDTEAAKEQCAKGVKMMDLAIGKTALEGCLAEYVKSGGKPVYSCSFLGDNEDVKPETLASKKSSCEAQCKAKAPQALKDYRDEQRHNAMHVKCCDGSRSPTCTYGNAGSGCCSAHGGACGED